MARQSEPVDQSRVTVGGAIPAGRVRACGVSATRTLQRSLLAPAEARAFVDEQLCPAHGPNAIAAVRLVASEVVLHAVRCGDGPIVVALECETTSVTLTVTCPMRASAGGTRLQLGDPISGKIVDSICRASGVVQTPDGQTMWCTLPTGHIRTQVQTDWVVGL